MKQPLFRQITFVASAFNSKQLPTLTNKLTKAPLPEMAFVGRSNVGKSSLINHLFNSRCAKTSSTPGKTQSINFYTIDEILALVDLPGYGYAQITKEIKAQWGELIDQYLTTRSSLKLIALLIDCRRSLTEEDLALIQWANFHQKPLIILLTKIDKLNTTEKQKLLQQEEFLKLPVQTIIPYSIKEESGRIALRKLFRTLVT